MPPSSTTPSLLMGLQYRLSVCLLHFTYTSVGSLRPARFSAASQVCMLVELSHRAWVDRDGGHILTLFTLFQLSAEEVSRFHEFKQNLVAKFRLLQVRASFFIDLSLVEISILQSFPDSVLCLLLEV